MHPSSVFAATSSRLHADLIVTRLKRAGISRNKISAIFPDSLRPNCAQCWLAGESKPANYEGESVAIAGPMHRLLSVESEARFIRSLQKVGVGVHDACAHAERLSKGEIILGIQTDDQAEIAVAWHTFRELEAEAIALGLSTEATERKTWFGRGTKASASSIPGLAYGAAV